MSVEAELCESTGDVTISFGESFTLRLDPDDLRRVADILAVARFDQAAWKRHSLARQNKEG
jgi:hypothetical protein